jgi:hypothetical protein
MIVDTLATLALIHKAHRTGDAALIAAADSVLSGLILHIKHGQAVLDKRLRPHLDVLTALH